MVVAIFVASLGWIIGCAVAINIIRRNRDAEAPDLAVQEALANAEALLSARGATPVVDVRDRPDRDLLAQTSRLSVAGLR